MKSTQTLFEISKLLPKMDMLHMRFLRMHHKKSIMEQKKNTMMTVKNSIDVFITPTISNIPIFAENIFNFNYYERHNLTGNTNKLRVPALKSSVKELDVYLWCDVQWEKQLFGFFQSSSYNCGCSNIYIICIDI